MDLSDRVAVVTGGLGGIGSAISRSLQAAGARVVITDIRGPEQAGDPVVPGMGALFLEHDICDARQWEDVLAAAENRFGPVDILVNNAGAYAFHPLEDHPMPEFEAVLRVNVVGAALGIRAVINSMKQAGRGSIVNVGSVGGLSGWWGLSAYCSSKWALRGLTRCAAIELAEYNIRVNAVMPGGVATAMRQRADESRRQARHQVPAPPIDRLASPGEVADAVLFLASESASFITGCELPVDGGLSA